MEKLFVDLTNEINAPASQVWQVLTLSNYTAQWAPEFANRAISLLCRREPNTAI
jgi:uncharacterized protein YndB with AHSA1/START domain